MNIESLMSTMNQDSYDLIQNANIKSNAIIINQCGRIRTKKIDVPYGQVLWIDSDEIGLSRSRNLALRLSSADICHLADDDLVYLDSYKEIILGSFNKYKDADIIAFIVEGIDGHFKNYSSKAKKLSFVSAMKVSSVQIAFKQRSIVENNISFNEAFGSGSKFYSGEENIFLSDCLRKGLKAYFVPLKIADVYLGESTWFEGFTERYFVTKGAVFSAISKKFGLLFILQFALRKKKLYQKSISFRAALKAMLRGRKVFLSEK